MLSIENEIAMLKPILSHPAGFNVGFAGILCIRSLEEICPPDKWEVDWEDTDGKHFQSFSDLDKALHFFVTLRHEKELGLDFEIEYYRKIK